MRHSILYCLLTALAFTSCKKAAQQKLIVADTISATINGVNENFNITDSARRKHTSTYYSLAIYARNNADASVAHTLQLFVFSPNPITTTTYALTPGSYNPPFVPGIVYAESTAANDLADTYALDYTGQHQIAITVTAIDSTSIRGTFNGTLIQANNAGATRTITNGKFHIYIK